MLKKILCIISIVFMVVAFSGCGQKAPVKYASEPENVTVVPGTWENGTYKGEFTGLSFTLPDGWISSDSDELSTLKRSEGNGSYEYDMMCQNEKTGSNVIVMYENLLTSWGSYEISEEEYLEAAQKQMTSMGYEIVDTGEATLSGNKYKMLEIYVEADGIGVKQYSLVRKQNGYMISVIIAAFGGDTYEDIIKNFN